MFIFPANNDSYRKRKRSHQACLQCKKLRKRCERRDIPPGTEVTHLTSAKCVSCAKNNIPCSLETAEGSVVVDHTRFGSFLSSTTTPVSTTPSSSTSALNSRLPSASSSAASLISQTNPPEQSSRLETPQSENEFLPLTGQNLPAVIIDNRLADTISNNSLGSRQTILSNDETNYLRHPTHTETEHTRQSHDSIPRLEDRSNLGPSNDIGISMKMFPVSDTPFELTTANSALGNFPMDNPSLNYESERDNNDNTYLQQQQQQQQQQSYFQQKACQPQNILQYKPDIKFISNSEDTPSMGFKSAIWVKRSNAASQPLNIHLDTYLASLSAFSIPIRFHRDGLIALYRTVIHPIFPIIDLETFMIQHERGEAPTLLLHAVLLVSARYPAAQPYLRQMGLQVRQFCSQTAERLRALLFTQIEQDKLTLIRVYALLSLHAEGADGLEMASGYLEKAIHYAISLGIHLNKPFLDKGALESLWWSLWCLDRISACVNARPLIINTNDIGVPMPYQDPTGLITLCLKLEQVVIMYRPGAIQSRSSSYKIDWEAYRHADQHTTLLQLLDCTGYILSHTSISSIQLAMATSALPVDGDYASDSLPQEVGKLSINDNQELMCTPLELLITQCHPTNNNISNINHTPGSPRLEDQNHESIGDVSLLQCARSMLRLINQNQTTLPPLPILPHAVSLVLGVYVHEMQNPDRISSNGVTMDTLLNEYKFACVLLEDMSRTWWTAGAVFKMGSRVYKKIRAEWGTKSHAGPNNTNGNDNLSQEPLFENNNNYNSMNSNGLMSHQRSYQSVLCARERLKRPHNTEIIEPVIQPPLGFLSNENTSHDNSFSSVKRQYARAHLGIDLRDKASRAPHNPHSPDHVSDPNQFSWTSDDSLFMSENPIHNLPNLQNDNSSWLATLSDMYADTRSRNRPGTTSSSAEPRPELGPRSKSVESSLGGLIPPSPIKLEPSVSHNPSQAPLFGAFKPLTSRDSMTPTHTDSRGSVPPIATTVATNGINWLSHQ
ncbi:hypothetical protein NADFUDRAFT_66906 [Nadsonia fulvescens var. elongata DSM 6958]|uniref:Zn(2)-C6 fungal-type domain-containing protein n=1 Tax=Nadsonia fulvescens var. elongata DSM 6958 TaxID=857566 RepID=A0A1E3PG11_9ASCO|nr:hypothetical protein NADFUDRAFT_66906 [Nadsonia fulvescens var. elongata DSM 6958]